MDDPSQCRALNVSDEMRCLETATSVNGLFCSFHSKQCQGLYRGYKLRNAKLDRLTANPPKFLAEAKVPLSNQTFQDVTTQETLKELHDHLFLKLQLLERVIRARKLHHSRFFSQDMDYGHARFLDSLQGQKAAITKALGRLERRTADVLYKKQKWFGWVRECQDEEEKTRDKEQKKVKAEAAMFRRHWKAAQLRQRDMRAKEDKLRQDAFLEQVYKERMAEREKNGDTETEDDEMDWDPIEDVLEDSRGSYVDLIEAFLWMAASEDRMKVSKEDISIPSPPALTETTESVTNANPNAADKPITSAVSKKSKSKKKKIQKEPSKEPTKETPAATQEPDKSLIESRQEMHDRLKNGEDFDNDRVVGMMIAGTIENPVIATKTVTFPEDQIASLQDEIFQIKHFLFCRLLLGHAALLPAALRANSVEEFLVDEEVTAGALRDLCLKMENPGLQEIRDACADLFRSEDEADEDVEEPQEQQDDRDKLKKPFDIPVFKREKQKGDLPDKWVPKREQAKKAAEAMGAMPTVEAMLGGEGGAVDFGKTKDSPTRTRKIKVRICGRTIWNYPSNKAMNRGGWLHFCILAKESNLHDAIALCRHWDEFFELNILAIWGYFPGKNWAEWVGNRWRQQMLQLGFIVYFESAMPDARALTVRNQQGGRRGQFRRSHSVFEARNFMCAHIKRDDQASRRLVQYLSMQSHRLLVLVRDAETGRLLIKPPEEERWLYRQKSGLGRAAKNDWEIVKSVGSEFFEDMDKYRRWNFSFKEYYDVYVWDLEAGECFPALYNAVQEMLMKALRCRCPQDLYSLAAPVLKTLCKDEFTKRVRDIKPGEDVESIYDEIHGPDIKFYYGAVDNAFAPDAPALQRARKIFEEDNKFPRNLFYNRADELEDEILFPEERLAQGLDPLHIGKIEPLRVWEEEGFSLRKFIEGWESDYTDDEDEKELYDDSGLDEEDLVDGDAGEDFEDIKDEDLDDQEGDIQIATVDRSEHAPIDPGHSLQHMPFSDELKDAMKRLSLKNPSNRPMTRNIMSKKPNDAEMREEFMAFLDKEKARIFKEVWHKADLAPHAQTRYIEMMEMTRKCRKYNHFTFDCAPVILALNLIDALNVGYEDKKDLHKAIAKLTPFFHPEFFASKDGEAFKDSLLFKQEERAGAAADTRSHHSVKMRPAEFFDELDAAFATADGIEDLPEEWDVIIRPTIAHLYKSGVIRTRADTYHEAQAFAAKELGRDTYDFYIESRSNMDSITMPPEVTSPYDVPSFKNFARAFTKFNPNARFAVLSLWSAPHFYPLMIGPDNHDPTSFRDLIGRSFIWKFVPKDMPCSEWSIHLCARQRIQPYKKILGERVVAKREKYLVMGTDEKDLFRLTSITAFAIQMRPWRWEVDL